MVLWERPDILSDYTEEIDFEALSEIRASAHGALGREHWQPLRDVLEKLPMGLPANPGNPVPLSVTNGRVVVGEKSMLDEESRTLFKRTIELLIPWRKGPFSLFGTEIDAEWRSDFKWDRIAPHLDELSGKRIADIGCSNGYYMFRASRAKPELIVGLDPSEKHYYSFELIQRFVQDQRLTYELLGIEHMSLFREFFDIVLCMGILYHQKDPLSALQGVREAMKPNGQVIVESQAIPGDEPVALFAPDRYAKMRNVYFVPTAMCIKAWMERAGFVEVEIFSSVELAKEEQRKTELAPYESLEDFLDPADNSRTVEGFPAPLRVAVKGRKKTV